MNTPDMNTSATRQSNTELLDYVMKRFESQWPGRVRGKVDGELTKMEHQKERPDSASSKNAVPAGAGSTMTNHTSPVWSTIEGRHQMAEDQSKANRQLPIEELTCCLYKIQSETKDQIEEIKVLLAHQNGQTERRLKVLENTTARDNNRGEADAVKALEAKMENKFFKKTIKDEMKTMNGLSQELTAMKYRNAQLEERLRKLEDAAKDDGKSAENSVRKYDKLKARLVAVERDASSTGSDLALLVSMMTAAAQKQSTVVCCCGGGGGSRGFQAAPPEWMSTGLTGNAYRQATPPPAVIPPPPTPATRADVSPPPTPATRADVSPPPTPATRADVSPPPLPPPPAKRADVAPPPPPPVATCGGQYERIPITRDMLKSVSLAKKGEPVKKIKLPFGMVTTAKRQAKDADASASAAAGPAAPRPAEPESFVSAPAPPLPEDRERIFDVPPPPPPPPPNGPLPALPADRKNTKSVGRPLAAVPDDADFESFIPPPPDRPLPALPADRKNTESVVRPLSAVPDHCPPATVPEDIKRPATTG